MRRDPQTLVFGVHLHQPVGNLDPVIDDHVEGVYAPFLRHWAKRDLGPVLLHLSGPLLEWLEERAHPLVDLVGELATSRRVEILAAGFHEPVLAALTPADRVDQVARYREHLRRRFGQPATTLWLTERVWEPSLPGDLARAGVETVLVDDRHLHLAGLGDRAAWRAWRTESDGRGVWLLAIDERLRYLVPFRPAEAFEDEMRAGHERGRRLSVLADDGEKFGGWPGTRRWVWEEGWMDRFTHTLESMVGRGEVRLGDAASAREAVPPGGLVYLPTASYREMEGWTLPPEAERNRAAAEARLADAPEAERIWVRGGQWRGFLARYPESNRMHKKAQALSRLCREAGDPQAVRRAVSRAQCNDAYWHGVFGGLYVRPLRQAVWRNLAEAEGRLREGEPLTAEVVDVDGDGLKEVWVHSASFSAVVAPHRGGALEELVVFERRDNLLDVLTRRRESYHRTEAGPDDGSDAHGPGDGEPRQGSRDAGDEGLEGGSIHEREAGLRLDALPPVDPVERVAFVEAALEGEPEAYPGALDPEAVEAAWYGAALVPRVTRRPGIVEVTLESPSPLPWFAKRYRFTPGGEVEVALAWDPRALSRTCQVVTAVSMSREVDVTVDPEPTVRSVSTIRTVSRTEQGWAHEEQGRTLTLAWSAGMGRARVKLDPR